MALHNLKIVVVDGGRSNNFKSSKSEGRDNPKDSTLYKTLNAKKTIKNKIQSGMSPSASFAMNMGLRVAGQLVTQTANYFISDIGRRNGDSNSQAVVNRQIEVVSDSLGIMSGIASGAATGAMFGAPGAVIGAVVGAASSAISLGFKYAERQREYEHTMFEQNTSQAYNLARANFSTLTGRLR